MNALCLFSVILTYKCQYFINILNDKKLALNSIGMFNMVGHQGSSGVIRCHQGWSKTTTGRWWYFVDRDIGLQPVTTYTSKSYFKGLYTLLWERESDPTLCIEFKFSILTGCRCLSIYPSQLTRHSSFAMFYCRIQRVKVWKHKFNIN